MDAVTAMRSTTAARVIEGESTPESLWQQWLPQQGFASLALAQCVAPRARLVVVAPHPDDEVLACGALLSTHVRGGGTAVVVAATDGEASHGHSASCDANALGAQRCAERHAGLALLGVGETAVQRLGLPDGRLQAHAHRIERALDRLLRPNDVVLTTWRHDGHPDHETCGHCAARIAARAGCRLIEAPVWMWHWSRPGDDRVPWHRLRALAVDETTQLQKVAALGAHTSQLQPRNARAVDATTPTQPVLGPAIVARNARAAEYFFM